MPAMVKYIVAIAATALFCYFVLGWPAYPFADHVRMQMGRLVEVVSSCVPAKEDCVGQVKSLRAAWLRTKPTQRGRELYRKAMECHDALLALYENVSDWTLRNKSMTDFAACLTDVRRLLNRYTSRE